MPKHTHSQSDAEADADALVAAIRRADRSARWQRIAAYVLIVGVTIFGFIKVQDVQDNQCKDAQANREGLRQEYIQITELGAALVADTPEPRKSDQIAKFEKFRDDNLKRYPPIECD